MIYNFHITNSIIYGAGSKKELSSELLKLGVRRHSKLNNN
jgi:hypothetical protein